MISGFGAYKTEIIYFTISIEVYGTQVLNSDHNNMPSEPLEGHVL